MDYINEDENMNDHTTVNQNESFDLEEEEPETVSDVTMEVK